MILTAVFFVTQINAQAAGPELSTGYTSDETSVTLEWSVSGKSSVRTSTVYKYDDNAKKFVKLTETNKTGCTVKNLKPGKAYKYKITAKLADGSSVSGTMTAYTQLEDIVDPDSYGYEIVKAYLYVDREKLMYKNCQEEICIYENKDHGDFNVRDLVVSKDGMTVFFRTFVEDNTYDALFRYSVRDKKLEMIYKDEHDVGYKMNDRIKDLYISDNMEYCIFRGSSKKYIWHDGKLSLMEYPDGNYVRPEFILNDGTVIFHDSEYIEKDVWLVKLFFYDPETKESNDFAEFRLTDPDRLFDYGFKFFPDTGTYLFGDYFRNYYYFNDHIDWNHFTRRDNQCNVYYGRIGSEGKFAFTADDSNKVISFNGKSAILCDNKYFYRMDLESGKKFNITKANDDDSYLIYSKDLGVAAYIDLGTNKLIRFSGWNSKKGAYTKRDEFDLGETTEDCWFHNSNGDFSKISVVARSYDEDGYTVDRTFIADFKNGTFTEAKNFLGFDRYGHEFYYETVEPINNGPTLCKNLIISDGKETSVIYEGCFEESYQNMDIFLFFPNRVFYDEDGLPGANIDACYVDKSGKAVMLEKNYSWFITVY